jgi:uncharacterized membrane protein
MRHTGILAVKETAIMNNRDNDRDQDQRNRGASPRRTSEFLPSPDLLEGYNYVVEGSAARIIAMFEAEQKHRHAWEDSALKTHTFSTILGQILGFVIAMGIFLSAGAIGLHGNSMTAAFIWVFGLAIVVMSGLVWLYAKSMGQRPLFARPAMRAHFRPEKDMDSEGKGVYVERRGR